MRSRTHANFCDYGMSGAGGAIPCTCGVSPAALTAEQAIRAAALGMAVRLHRSLVASDGVYLDDVTDTARRFEAYIRGET